ncbi:N-acetylneuraminate synthase [Paramagnetospirillum kuznetsovii]|uniref:N-acetylneuraminate synthase n=1 Tax=Paramagnetospirillum kuznetsovii TaxID=2053833 RepID=A0A364P2G7_9PROT|nr:N-acetylneuraminate synthase [Paramagnetospirillum kuznetsovii]RAU23548.1 N-acetylneuraminate synthase [Paramagnetospirillum kuznetsovii]
MSVTIIAEAGVNHNGDLAMALDLVDAAAAAGADAVKFQTFKAEEIIGRHAPKAEYALRATGADESFLDMVRKLELDEAAHRALIRRCAERAIAFLSTPFDRPSLALLAGPLGLKTLKLPSGELTNAPLLLDAARSGCAIILSTGMSTLGEVETALGVLAFGLLDESEPPGAEAFARAWGTAAGRQRVAERVTLLHCTTEYPAAFADVNLRAMDSLAQAFGVRVGLSDHTPGIAVALAATARGATVIEKHFTLDRSLPGPDHQASLEPAELTAMITGIRQVEAALGDGIKAPAAAELKNIPIARKCLVARRAIAAGEMFTADNLAVKRAGGLASPLGYWARLGTAAQRSHEPDEPLDP